VPVPLRHAVVQVLQAWGLEEPPDGIVAIGSLTRPRLVSHLADGLARYLGLPLLTGFSVAGQAPPGQGAANSAQRLRVVADRYRLDDPGAVAGRRILLIDDRSVTGWTLAVTARALKQAGVLDVHPLVLSAG
jgi:ATP-dependent DNA helicase RecQ